MSEQEFYQKLVQFTNVLKQEQHILKHNQPAKLAEIVAKKEIFVEVLNAYTGDVTPKLKTIINEIKVLQDQNLLLTQMEMSYQANLMDAVRESVKNSRNPYGKQANNTTAATLLVDTDM